MKQLVGVTHHTVEFYIGLAYLFYAIAAADRSVRTAEKKKIEELVDQNWPVHFDDYGSSEIIFSTLKKLIETDFNHEQLFQNFGEFSSQNQKQFPIGIGNRIIDNADCATIAFSGRINLRAFYCLPDNEGIDTNTI